jgi:hypothetical protein
VVTSRTKTGQPKETKRRVDQWLQWTTVAAQTQSERQEGGKGKRQGMRVLQDCNGNYSVELAVCKFARLGNWDNMRSRRLRLRAGREWVLGLWGKRQEQEIRGLRRQERGEPARKERWIRSWDKVRRRSTAEYSERPAELVYRKEGEEQKSTKAE